jgi:chlorophyllide a reductase subunit X
LFEGLATQVAEAPPMRPKPLSQDELLALFKGEAVGRGVVLQPATEQDMLGARPVVRTSLEVLYDDA